MSKPKSDRQVVSAIEELRKAAAACLRAKHEAERDAARIREVLPTKRK